MIPVLFVLVAFEARIVRMDEWSSGRRVGAPLASLVVLAFVVL